jgi:hypothetical protein
MTNNAEKKRPYSVLQSGRIVVDVRALLDSDWVKKDLGTLRTRIEESAARLPESDQR